ncbi:MAG: lipopolysaccharide biosynthesis, partial [Merismopedia sp. SIO2A8]|nr:lipopolysaccharide biosynthesis [Merismopedia sp. SIO2A8]
IGLASFALITGIAGVFSLQQEPPPKAEPRFKAEGLLKIITPPTIFSETGELINSSVQELEPETLLTEEVLQKAASVAGAKPDKFMESLGVKKTSEAEITVTYEDEQPQVAATTVESLMQNMIQQSYSNNTAQLRVRQESIEERLEPAQKELDVAEQQLERFRRTEGTALLAAQDGTLVSAITTSEQQQRQLELDIERVTTEINSLETRLGLTADEAYTASALSADPTIAQLRQQILDTETQLQILSRDLRPEHPQMIELRKQIDSYEQLLQNRGNEVRGGNGLGEPLAASKIRIDSSLDPARQQIANQLVSLQTQLETLQTSLAVTKRTRSD